MHGLRSGGSAPLKNLLKGQREPGSSVSHNEADGEKNSGRKSSFRVEQLVQGSVMPCEAGSKGRCMLVQISAN